MLANDKAGRARAFFKGSSRLDLLDFGLTASGCRVVDRNLFGTGPASSAEESGRGAGAWIGLETAGCDRLVRCTWMELSGRNVSLDSLIV